MRLNTDIQQEITSKKKKRLLIIGFFLGFISGFGFFALKVTEHAKNSTQLMVKRTHNEYQH